MTIVDNTQSFVSIVHWNCFKLNSVRRHELHDFLNKTKPSIVSLNETKLTKEEANYHLRFDNYSTFYKPRPKNPNLGGGVALLIRNDIQAEQTTIFDQFTNDEIIGTYCILGKKKTLLASYYVPPNIFPNTEIFNKIESSGLEFIICGDLNSCSEAFGSKKNNTSGDALINIINDKQHDVIQ